MIVYRSAKCFLRKNLHFLERRYIAALLINWDFKNHNDIMNKFSYEYINKHV